MSNTHTKTLNVLLLGTPACGEEFAHWIETHAHVRRVDDLEAALELLKTETFDFVLSPPADIQHLQATPFHEQIPALFDSVNQGVCVVDREGNLVWANPKMLSFPEELRTRVCRCCRETFEGARAEGTKEGAALRGRRFSLTTEGNEFFEVNATPISDQRNQLSQVAAVVWNTTDVRRLQDKIDAIDRAGRALVSLDTEKFSQLDTQERLELLEQKILESVHDVLHFDNFAIMVLDRNTNKLEMVLSYGMSTEAQRTEMFATTESSGISGYVAARGRSYICPDVTRDPRYLSGIPGACSSLTVPLKLHDEVVGVANFESIKQAGFNEDDRQFAEIFGRHIALALHILELLVSERYNTTGKLGSNVMAEITGPLNDILSEVERLTEDYIGHDDLRHRLRSVSENAVKIRDSIKDVITAKPGLVGSRSGGADEADPLLVEKCILVADDEDIIRETIHDVLSGCGCRVVCAQDGERALQLIGEHSLDLVLSDIKMPGKNGYEVFAAAKEANAATPVILMTGFGYDPNHSIVRARREGLAAVLFKPFKVDQLLDEIRSALRPAEA